MLNTDKEKLFELQLSYEEGRITLKEYVLKLYEFCEPFYEDRKPDLEIFLADFVFNT